MLEQWRARSRKGLTSAEAQELMASLRQRLRNEVDGKVQAEIDSRNGETVSNLIQALENVSSACVTIGSLALIKATVRGEPQIIVRQLSATEVEILARYPDLHKTPERFLEILADGVRVQAIEAAEGNDRRDPPTLTSGHS